MISRIKISDVPYYQSYTLDGVKHTQPKEVFRVIDKIDFYLIDIRENDEYAQGIPSVGRHLKQYPMSQFVNYLPSLAKDIPLVIMCAHGIRSINVTSWLIQNGWDLAINLDGGFENWLNSGMEI